MLRAGPLEVALDGIDLRYVRLGPVELVRRIHVAVRDSLWNTIPGSPSDVDVTVDGDTFVVAFAVQHRADSIDFSWQGRIHGTEDGRIRYEMDGAVGSETLYNRIGICVLHPWREFAGQPFRADTPGGPIAGSLPMLVGRQPFEDGNHQPLFPSMSRLEVALGPDLSVVDEFSGDLFEMEDQRNWSDASFKAYSTPLALGIPHRLQARERISQNVVVSFAGTPAMTQDAGTPTLDIGADTGIRVPPIGLTVGATQLSNRDVGLLRSLAPAHLRSDVHLRDPAWQSKLANALRLCEQCDAALEVALFLCAGDDVDELARLLAGVDVVRVLVLPEGAQTATPEETTPPSLVTFVRERLNLDGVPVAGGTDMNFCELNRTRPQTVAMDGIFWSINPQAHASDDISLLETPEAQGEQVRAALAFADRKPLYVGPITLAPRSAPLDARQSRRIAAAWTAASVKYLTGAGAAALTYFEAAGPAGVVDEGRRFPVYDVLARACELRGADVLSCEASAPLEVVGLAVRRDGMTSVLSANLTDSPQTVALRGPQGSQVLELGPYDVTLTPLAS